MTTADQNEDLQPQKRIKRVMHGHYGTPEYRAWYNIKQRVSNPKNSHFKYYGGRGITMCEEWSNSFMEFFNHVGKRPSKLHTIDRINNDGNYEPGNVRWATYTEQQLNQGVRRSHSSGYKGVHASGWGYKVSIYLLKDKKEQYIGHEKDLDNAVMLRMAAEEQLR